MEQLTLAQARRIALAAQGLAKPRRTAAVTMRQVQAEIDRVAQFQIDTVNVVQRAQYVPLWSRLGAYDTALLDRAAEAAPRRLFEYWGHAASLIDVSLAPALRFRMAANAERYGDTLTRLESQHPGLVDKVLRVVADEGPVTARQIDHDQVRVREHWGWNWSAVKQVLEHHFSTGVVSSAGRNSQFERRYALTERVLPPEVQHLDWDETRQKEALLRRAGRALGVFSMTCVTDYFYLRRDAETVRAFDRLEASGEFVPTRVRGWEAKPTWRWHEAVTPRRVSGRTLLSPFDSMMFQRDRIEALFDYLYRIEIYVPEAKRQHGYYVYSFLLDDELCARVDLKAHRATATLQVKATWFEPSVTAGRQAETAAALAAELQQFASWLGLSEVAVVDKGTGAQALVRALG